MPSPLNILLSTSGGTPTSSNFTVNVHPASPYVGEAFGVYITGDGSHTGYTDQLEDIWVESNMGDAGISYKQRGSSARSRDVGYGRAIAHAYDTDGVKDIVTSSWTFGAGIKTQTTQVSPLHPDNETWDKTIWCDASDTPSSVGMDAEDASNEHALGEAAVRAAINLRAGATSTSKYRIRWRGGVEHKLDFNTQFRISGGVIYFDSFGTGRATITDSNATFQSIGVTTLFWPQHDDARFIVTNLSLLGTYDPVHGINRTKPIIGFGNFGRTNTLFSFYDVYCKGVNDVYGVSAAAETSQFHAFDCYFEEWENFAMWGGECYGFAVRGIRAEQTILAHANDGKLLYEQIQAPDHSFFRVQAFQRGGVSDCLMRTRNGWTGTQPRDIQPNLRLYNQGVHQFAGAWCSVIFNESLGGRLADVGRMDTNSDIPFAFDMLFFGNEHKGCWYDSSLVRTHAGGVRLICNTLYLPDLDIKGSPTSTFLAQGGYTALGTVALEAWQNRSVCKFNTLVSHRTNTTDTFYETIVNEDSYWLSPGATSGQTIETEGNILSANDTYANAASMVDTSEFSLGGQLRNITGGLADSTVASGPPTDFAGVRRVGVTQQGAFHTAAPEVIRPAPTYVSGIVIGLADVRSNTMIVTDVGTWTNIDYTEEQMMVIEWFVSTDGGSTFSASGFKENGVVVSSGNHVYATITRTNTSGVVVTGTSSTFIVP